MADSTIQWTQQTWNPTTGCTKISTGCKRCYAEKMHKRLMGMGQAKYTKSFDTVVMHPAELTRDFGKKPKLIFVNSMSDLFHQDVTLDFIQQVFAAIARNPQHTYQVLTKRGERLEELSPFLDWPDNLWMGVSIEDKYNTSRADNLRKCGAKVKFLSLEPLVGFPTFLSVVGIHWVIVGGESAKGARSMNLEWLDEILLTCKASNVPLFVKQMGCALAKSMGLQDSKGGNMDEWPLKYRVRQWPEAVEATTV